MAPPPIMHSGYVARPGRPAELRVGRHESVPAPPVVPGPPAGDIPPPPIPAGAPPPTGGSCPRLRIGCDIPPGRRLRYPAGAPPPTGACARGGRPRCAFGCAVEGRAGALARAWWRQPTRVASLAGASQRGLLRVRRLPLATRQYVGMYVCMYVVCLFACMYICMYVYAGCLCQMESHSCPGRASEMQAGRGTESREVTDGGPAGEGL